MYEMIIYWSDEDNRYLVEVPELPGCMADGKTRVEAVANAEASISEWIEIAREDGRDIPEPKKLTALDTAKYIENRGSTASRDKYMSVLKKAPHVRPREDDVIN